MSTIAIATATFIANAKTSVVYGRPLTTDELAQLNAVRITAVTAGRQCSLAQVTTEAGQSITYWTDISDANAYAAVANGFSPAPTTSCTVTSV